MSDALSGFDSEADRRDAIRRQIVDTACDDVLKVISKLGVTYTPEERTYLQMRIIERLVKGVCLESMSQLFRQEIHTAQEGIDRP